MADTPRKLKAAAVTPGHYACGNSALSPLPQLRRKRRKEAGWASAGHDIIRGGNETRVVPFIDERIVSSLPHFSRV